MTSKYNPKIILVFFSLHFLAVLLMTAETEFCYILRFIASEAPQNVLTMNF